MTVPHVIESYSHAGLAGRIEVYAELDSTNTRLRELAGSGAPDGTVVVAESQSAGRGRHGRQWHSPAGAGLYASILLRPAIVASRAHILTLAAAVAVAESLRILGVADIEIKWPNDVLAGGRKICGILTETSLIDGRIDTAVVGIGINLRESSVPGDLVGVATSIEEACGPAGLPSSMEVLRRLLGRLSAWRPEPSGHSDPRILARWTHLSPMSSGAAVRIDDGSDPYHAITDGLADDGRLRVVTDAGELQLVSAADVSLRRA